MNNKRVLGLVICLAFSASAIAQDSDYSTENGIYVSAQGTLMQWTQPLYPVANGLPNFQDDASAATLLVGYRMFGGKLAVEVGVMDDLTFHETITNVVPNFGLDLTLDDTLVRALWRFTGRGDASFIVGAGYHDITYTAQQTNITGGAVGPSASEDQNENSILVGGEIDGPSLTLRVAYEQFISLDDEARNRGITFGVGWRF